MSLKLYEIDRRAQDLTLKFRDKDVLGESHKMRMTTAYGLERFWGEQLRLQQKSQDKDKADFWKATWKTLHSIMKDAGVDLPNDTVKTSDTDAIRAMSDKLWGFDIEQRKVTLSILTELCDSLVWWTQRYKKSNARTGE
jgi:inorganic triphosphatase YgiF